MFKQSLEKIVSSTADAIGAILMGYDGIGIESFRNPDNDTDMTLLGIEYSNTVKEIRNTAEILQNGELEEVSIKTDRYYVIIRHLTAEYFAALVLKRSGNFGQGRYQLLKESYGLREALLG